jgi:hypothetical protein
MYLTHHIHVDDGINELQCYAQACSVERLASTFQVSKGSMQAALKWGSNWSWTWRRLRVSSALGSKSLIDVERGR